MKGKLWVRRHRFKEIVKTVFGEVWDYTIGDIWRFLIDGIWPHGVMVFFLFVIGCGLVGARMVTVESLTIAGDVVTVVLKVFDDIEDGIDFVAAKIADIINDIPGVSISLDPLNLPTYTAAGLFGGTYETLVNLEAVCIDYTTWYEVLVGIIQVSGSVTLCCVERFTYNIPIVYTVMHGVFGWMTLDPSPFPGGNCKTNILYDIICIVMGTGYVILGFIVPLLIIYIFRIGFGNYISLVIGIVWDVIVELLCLWTMILEIWFGNRTIHFRVTEEKKTA